MLSIFPYLLSWEQLSPLIIRIVLGITLAHFGYLKIMKRGQSVGTNSVIYGVVQAIISVFLIIGLYTQLAALLTAVMLVIKLGLKARNKALLSSGVNYYILMLVMSLSLLVTGAGWLAFDLPL